MSPTQWNKEKGANMDSGHVYAMKNLHRTLQDMHDDLQQNVEYAQPPKPIKMKEEADLFTVFAEDVRADVKQMFEMLNEEYQQAVIEMIEAEDYDTVISITKDIVGDANG